MGLDITDILLYYMTNYMFSFIYRSLKMSAKVKILAHSNHYFVAMATNIYISSFLTLDMYRLWCYKHFVLLYDMLYVFMYIQQPQNDRKLAKFEPIATFFTLPWQPIYIFFIFFFRYLWGSMLRTLCCIIWQIICFHVYTAASKL
jgi:hypothetical protein